MPADTFEPASVVLAVYTSTTATPVATYAGFASSNKPAIALVGGLAALQLLYKRLYKFALWTIDGYRLLYPSLI